MSNTIAGNTIAPAIAHATSVPSKPSYTITVAVAHDIPVLATIQWAALTSNPLIKTLYPYGPTPALIAFTRTSYTKALQFPSVRIIKATDTASGEIVAFAKWIKYPEETIKPPEGARGEIQSVGQTGAGGWGRGTAPSPKPEDVDKRALDDWNDVITRMRKGVMKSRRHICRARPEPCGLECYFGSIAPALWVLDIIHTHPSHQGLGAAAQLVAWGTSLADAERCPCYVESSPVGYPLFQTRGFADVAEMAMELNRYRGKQRTKGYGQYRYKHVVMVRPPPQVLSPKIPPKVPPKDDDLVTRGNRTGYWDFGLASAAGESDGDGTTSRTTSSSGRSVNSDDEQEEGPAGWVSNQNRRYGVVGAVGGTREEPFRPQSHYGVLDSVSVDDGGSRPTSRVVPVPGGEGEERERERGSVEVV